jgi:hypothetical protein
MSPINSLPSERVAIVGNIDPDAYTAGTYTTGWIALKDFKRFMAVVQAGDLGSSATLDAKLTAATSSGGAGSADITGAAITQLTQAGTDSNKQVVINLDTSGAFLAGSAYTHFRLSMTVGTATSDAGGIVFGLDPVSAPASDTDSSTVDEIVSV